MYMHLKVTNDNEVIVIPAIHYYCIGSIYNAHEADAYYTYN